MTIYTEAPCTVGRGACGMKCAREFGNKFALTNRRSPNHDEIEAHIPLFNSYSFIHQKNMRSAAWSAAFRMLQARNPCPPEMLKAVEQYKDYFAEQGWNLHTNFSTDPTPIDPKKPSHGFTYWTYRIAFDGTETKLAAGGQYNYNYSATTLIDLVAQLARDTSENYEEVWEEKVA